MTKGKSTWKYNKLLTARRNYFWPGGSILGNTEINIPGMSSINLLDRVNSLKSIDSTQAIHNTVDLRDPAGNAIRNVPTLNFSYDNLIKKPSDPELLKVPLTPIKKTENMPPETRRSAAPPDQLSVRRGCLFS